MNRYSKIIRIFAAGVITIMASNLPMNGQNYIKSETFLDDDAAMKVTDISYFDGLGRESLSASNGIGTGGKFVYRQTRYDNKDRVSTEWLPIPGSTTASEVSYSDLHNLGYTYYGDYTCYCDNSYDALDRTVMVMNPGIAWRTANKPTRKTYDTNSANSVKRYRASLENDSLIWNQQYYPAGTLTFEETTDEDGRRTQVYKDFLERTIMERYITGDSLYDTYYVYNDRNQLRFVLTPEFQKAGWKYQYAYEYRYDNHGRIVKVRRPECATENRYYDKDGRLIYMQDAAGWYKFFFYDSMGRQVIKGTCSNFNYHHYQDVSMLTSGNGLFGTGYNYNQPTALTHAYFDEVAFYDNYAFLGKNLFTSSPHAASLSKTNPANAAGLLTGSAVRTSSNQILLTVYYYDDQGRLVDKRETLPNGGTRITVTSYSFTDKPLTETSTLTIGGTTTTVIKTYEYYTTNDQLMKLSITYNGGTPVTVAEYEYNDVGGLSKLTRGGDAGETSYTYNLRGWTTGITGNGFSEWLHYTDGLGTPYYSGNISTQQWQTDNETVKRGYKFHYDGLGRMTKAEYAEGDNMNVHVGRYTEWVREYTFSNAIRKLERFGRQTASGNYGKIDNLRMYYSGMQILKVKEDAYPLTYTGAFDYVTDIVGTEPNHRQYDYYDDGSLMWDEAKGVSLISYDRYSRPQSVQFTNGNQTEYDYSATGQKLRTVYRTAVPNISVPIGSSMTLNASNTLSVDSINYVGDFIFENGSLSKYLFSGGYATIANGLPTWHYYVQDHLGNNRAVINHNGTIEQVNHYYPFGAIYGDVAYNDNTQRYKYNGKELDRMHGLNYYDYGARHYDPLLCRFTQMDPLAEKYYGVSPYAYCGNNPVNRIDSDGRAINWLVGGLIGAGVELGSQLIENYDTEESIIDNFSQNVNWTNVAIAAGEGALTSGSSALKGLGTKVAVSAVASAAKEVSDQVKEGANSYKEINYKKVVKSTITGAIVTGESGKIAKVKTYNKFKDVKATPQNAVKHKRAGQKRYSKSAQRRANQALRKQKEEYANKTEGYANAFMNVIKSLIERE